MAEEMSSTLISPTKLADAIFNSIPPIAAETCEGCISEVNEHLKNFGYNVTKLCLKHLKKRPTSQKHRQFSSGTQSIQKLYCSRCTTHDSGTLNNNGHIFQCSVVAEVKYYRDKKKMKVVKLFPHPKECLMDEKKKTKWIMSQCNNGIGWTKLEMNYSVVVGGVFGDIFDKINNLTKSDLGDDHTKHGKIIKSGMDDPPDRRFYFKISDHENNDNIIQEIIMNYDLNNPSFQKDLGHLQIRLVLFLANHLDIASELPFEITNYPTNVYPTDHILPPSAPHLSLTGESIILGGYMNDEYRKKAILVHQIPHNDIGEQVNGVDESPWSVSNNPDLRDKFKPGSIIIPNTTRDIYVFSGNASVEKRIVKLEKNEMIVFEGDLVHGGMSYVATPEEKLVLYPSIHYFLASTHHKRDLDEFHISAHHCLHVDEFKDYVSTISISQVVREFRRIRAELRNTVTKIIADERNDLTIINNAVKQIDELTAELATFRMEAEKTALLYIKKKKSLVE